MNQEMVSLGSSQSHASKSATGRRKVFHTKVSKMLALGFVASLAIMIGSLSNSASFEFAQAEETQFNMPFGSHAHPQVLGAVSPIAGCDYFAAPDGNSSGDGTTTAWDLQTALNKTSLITGTKVLCLKGGTYIGKFTSTLNGGVVRSAPGEWAKLDGFKVTTLTAPITASSQTIDVADTTGFPSPTQLIEVAIGNEVVRIFGRNGNTLTVYDRGASGSTGGATAHNAGEELALAGNGLFVTGGNTTYRDFEVMTSDPIRDANLGAARTWGRGGLTNVGNGNKFINLVLHDNLSGIFTGNNSSNTEIYGNIIYNNGSKNLTGGGSGHGMYLENGSGYHKVYSNIVYNSYNLGMQLYGVTAAYVGGDLEDNVWANSGAPLVNTRNRNAVVGPESQQIPSITMLRNHFYHQPGSNGYGVILGYGAGIATGTFSGNYIIGGGNAALVVENTGSLTGSGNNIYDPNVAFASYLHMTGYSTFNWNNNTYHKAGNSTVFAAPGSGVYDFASWKSLTGLDSASTATSVAMPNRVIIVPNIYQAGRANVYIYATAGGSTANIDLSQAGLTNGQAYEIRNPQNYFGSLIASGTYNSSSPTITVSLTGAAATVAAPIGTSLNLSSSCPLFCPMVILPTSSVITPPPGDTTPPTVVINSPLAGATLSGTTTINTTTSDNVGVVGVQFKVDGNNIGSEVTTSPFLANFNTTTVTNGSHTLSATARDAAGNTVTSTLVTVTVNNQTATLPVISSFTASPSSITAGNSSTLSWSGTGATSLSINQGIGTVTGTSRTVSPTVTTTYTLTASNSLGTATATVTITVGTVSDNLPSGPLSRYPNNPIVPMGVAGSIDDEKTGPRVVLQPGTPAGSTNYRMYYEAVGGPNKAKVGYATSTDGKTWVKQGSIASLNPSTSWEGGSDGEVSPNSILIENGVYKLWYHSFGTDLKRRIGYATSNDGLNWTKNPNPVLDVGALGSLEDQHVVEPRVFKIGSAYRMYYTGNESANSGIGTARWFYATSNDGVSWTRRGQIWSKQTDNGFGIIFDGTKWHAWYGMAFAGIYYASSNDGLTWTDGPSNPVLLPSTDPAAPDSGGLGDSVSAYRDTNEYRIMFTGGRYNSFGRLEAISLATYPASILPPPTDTTPPTATITSPISGATLTGTPVITVSVSDNVGVAGVQWKVDGLNIGAEVTSAPYSANFNTTTVSNGSHVLTAVARDAAGNTGTSAAVSITVNNQTATLPVISSFTASPSSITAGSSSTLSWSSTGATSLSINQGVGTVTGTSRTVSPTVTTTYTLTATNSAGTTVASTTVTVTAAPVNQRPTGSLDGVNANTATIFGWANDPDDLSVPVTVHIYIDQNAGTTGATPYVYVANENRSDVGNHAYNFLIPPQYRDGSAHQVWVWALDLTNPTSNNTQLAGSPKPFTITVQDTTPPTVVINSPVAGATLSGTITITTTTSDNVGVVGVQFKVDSANIGSEVTTAPFSANFNTTTVTNGSHTLSAIARDASGNTVTSTLVSVSVNNQTQTTVATPTITPSGGSFTTAQSVTLATTTSGAVIRYTTNGTDPTSSSSQYSVPLTISSSTTVKARAYATGFADSAIAAAVFTVNIPNAPTATFTASPTTITAGSSSTLSWTTSGATSVSIDQGIGVVTGTSVIVSPTATTTYTLTATNSVGSVTKSVTVTVNSTPPPSTLPVINSFTATPSTIVRGNSSTLSWSVTGATKVAINQSVGTVSSTGTTVVSPSRSKTYQLTAYNAAGRVSRSVKVTVGSKVLGDSTPYVTLSSTEEIDDALSALEDGTPIKVANDPTVYILGEGSNGATLLPVPDQKTLELVAPGQTVSQVDIDITPSIGTNAIIPATSGLLGRKSNGEICVFIKTNSGLQKYCFKSAEEFLSNGYKFDQAMSLPDSDVNAVPDTAQYSLPAGTDFVCENSPTVYYFDGDHGQAFGSAGMYKLWNSDFSNIVKLSAEKCSAISKLGFVRPPRGTVVKRRDDQTVYKYSDGMFTPYTSVEEFQQDGKTFDQIVEVGASEIE